MNRVLDSSVGFKWVVAETDTDKALRLRDDFRHGVVTLLAPDVFPVEVAHALTRAERQGRVPTQQGNLHMAAILANLPLLFSSLALLPGPTTSRPSFASAFMTVCTSPWPNRKAAS